MSAVSPSPQDRWTGPEYSTLYGQSPDTKSRILNAGDFLLWALAIETVMWLISTKKTKKSCVYCANRAGLEKI